MTKEDSIIIGENLRELKFSRVDHVNRLLRSVYSVRQMNTYVAEQLTKNKIANPNPIDDFDFVQFSENISYLTGETHSEENEKKYTAIYSEVNSLCWRILDLGNKHNIWE